jgi:hypothetical protein
MKWEDFKKLTKKEMIEHMQMFRGLGVFDEEDEE